MKLSPKIPKPYLRGMGIPYLLLPLLSLAILIGACEKDDICVEGDTPLLILRFYNISDTSALKAVPGLRIIGIGNGEPVNTFADRSSRDSVAIPLRIDQGSTQFQFISNSAGEEGAESGNIDTLEFSYDIEEVFISRACGFVANYTQLTDSLPTDTDNWIQDIQIALPTVNSQLQAHVKIYH